MTNRDAQERQLLAILATTRRPMRKSEILEALPGDGAVWPPKDWQRYERVGWVLGRMAAKALVELVHEPGHYPRWRLCAWPGSTTEGRRA